MPQLTESFCKRTPERDIVGRRFRTVADIKPRFTLSHASAPHSGIVTRPRM